MDDKDLSKINGLLIYFIYLLVILDCTLLYPKGYDNTLFSYFIVRLKKFDIFNSILLLKTTEISLVFLSSIGAKARKSIDFNIKKLFFLPIFFSLICFLLIYFIVPVIGTMNTNISINYPYFALYCILSFIAVIAVHIAFNNLSKIIKEKIGEDKFNLENESFLQVQKKITNDFSINIPTKFYFKGKMRDGWINIVNPFRGTWVLGTPGSGKTFSIIEPIIRQHSAKGFALVVYDYKFPTLATKLFYHYNLNKERGKIPSNCGFKMINFTQIEYSHRINPIQQKYIPNLAAASETASTLLSSLQKGKTNEGGNDDFFKKSAENFLASIIFFFTRYENGKYSSMAHVLAFLNQDYKTIFEVLSTNEEVMPLLAPFKSAFTNNAMEQLEGMIGTLRVSASRLATKEAFWIFTGDDFDLKISDPQNPNYLLLANDPEMEEINGSLNALIINRMMTRINSGQGQNIPCNIIIDELPTLYFHKIDRLVGTARSNKVAVTLGFQELPQLEADYGKVGMEKVISVCANVICASARHNETLSWLSNSIFGKVKQLKKGLSIDHTRTSISINEEMGELIPASKIADMPTGFLCGQTAKDFVVTKTKSNGEIDILNSEEFTTTKFFAKTNFNMDLIKEEEKNYVTLPKIYNFGTEEEKEKKLNAIYRKVNQEIENICKNVLEEITSSIS